MAVMAMPRSSGRLMWAGRVTFVVIIAGLVVYLVISGLDKADKVASSTGLVVALVALAAPYLVRRAKPAAPANDAAPDGPGFAPGNATQINQAFDQGRIYGLQGGDMTIGDDDR